MSWQFSIYTLPLALSGVFAVAAAYFSLGERPKPGSVPIAGASLVVGAWGFGQALLVTGASSGPLRAGWFLTLVSIAFIVPTWTLFALQYTGRDHLMTRRTVGLLLVEPAVFLGLLATNGTHHLLYSDLGVTTHTGRVVLTYSQGPLWVPHYLYVYGALVVPNWLLVRKFFASRNVYRKRTFFFVTMSAALTIGHILGRADQLLGGVDLSPTPYTSLGVLAYLLWGLLALLLFASSRYLSLIPIDRLVATFGNRSKSLATVARDTAIEELNAGFLVIDHRNRVVDINSLGKRILGRGDERVVGKQLKTVMPPEIFLTDDTTFLDATVTGEYAGIWIETPTGKHRCFDATVSTLATAGEETRGRVALISDVTERERRKQTLEARTSELERQNDQLESFANVVSHDLRNPLNVANGRLELLEATVESGHDHIDDAKHALDRMEQIIDDVLTLARLGQTVSDTEPVDLAAVATDAWDHVQAREATLDCTLDIEVEGDRGRLLQVFENFFRNAVEHGREDVTITVGQLQDGFYVEDDGPGIPVEHRTEVLDEGFTTAEDGTGFGLSIIETIVSAHGWEITVTDSETDGARFEISNVLQSDTQITNPAP
ncbi:MAG: histidine kinase N-terminal 7TM domain-containing protein [Halorientalis sp.]